MSLQKQINDLQVSLQQMLQQVQTMQEEIEKLESENDRLRNQLAPTVTGSPSMLGGQQVLQKLYEDGYHVCPSYYGKEHGGDGCLLCLGVLKNVTTR